MSPSLPVLCLILALPLVWGYGSTVVTPKTTLDSYDEYTLTQPSVGEHGYDTGDLSVYYVNMKFCYDYVSYYNQTCVQYIQQQAVFFPYIDSMTLMVINDSYLTYVLNSSSVTVMSSLQIQVSTLGYNGTFFNSTWVNYMDSTGTYLVGAWTMIVNMTLGKVQALGWEEGCDECTCWGNGSNSTTTDTTTSGTGDQAQVYIYDCSTAQCISSVCGFNKALCQSCQNCTDATCNMKIYLVWQGTNSKGLPLTSINSRPSVFREFGFTRSYIAAAGVQSQNFIFD